jgi:hypothetical protein
LTVYLLETNPRTAGRTCIVAGLPDERQRNPTVYFSDG